MTEVLHSSSSSPSSPPPTVSNATLVNGRVIHEDNVKIKNNNNNNNNNRDASNQLSLIALLVALFRKSFMLACKKRRGEMCSSSSCDGGIEIGWPTDVQHVAHVTFDRFNGFLGLPVEFEPEVPTRPPSASTTVFGVSTESMQLSYDRRGNSIPTILLLLQRRLYGQGGLQAEGIFRINAENSQNEYVRDQLNRGIVPEDIDVHCLAGLIKAWFRELPVGILDALSPERVMQCQSEEDCIQLVRLLPPIETALLDWAINLMADVVQEEHLNKMNSRNIAVVFAPNMTQMADPLTALMYAVQVMNFLKTLIERTLRERQDAAKEPPKFSQVKPSDDDGHPNLSQLFREDVATPNEPADHVFVVEEPDSDTAVEEHDSDNISDSYNLDDISVDVMAHSTSTDESDGKKSCDSPSQEDTISTTRDAAMSCPNTSMDENTQINKIAQSSDHNQARSTGKQFIVQSVGTEDKIKGINNLIRINAITERVRAWR
ncbi:hypothetical protein Leryth_012098 [Lithospermum erythrorhizon]|nr:hypothetical protein Leryth_012098 [Lithospermum erythrorhizon]